MRTGRSIACSSSAKDDDLVEALADLRALEPVDGAVQEDVLAAAEVGVEAGAELEQRADPAADVDASRRRLDDPGDQAQQRRLAGAVAADEPDRLARLDGERHVFERLHVLRLGAAAEDEQLLQAARLVRVDAEAARDPVDPDLARLHALNGTAAARRTSPASTRTNAGSAFGSSIRSSSRPSSAARSCASTSRSHLISRWSATKPTGADERPRGRRRRRARSGARGCPGRARARPSATRSGTRTTTPSTPAFSATRRDVSSSSSL